MYTEGLTPILESDGETHEFIGEPESLDLLWHQHLLFVADVGTPIGTILTADFTLVDLDGLHGNSAPFTLSFIVVPEPATCIFLLLPAILLKNARVQRRGSRYQQGLSVLS